MRVQVERINIQTCDKILVEMDRNGMILIAAEFRERIDYKSFGNVFVEVSTSNLHAISF